MFSLQFDLWILTVLRFEFGSCPETTPFFFLFFVWVVFDDYPVNIGFSDSDSPANFRGIHGREQR